MSRPRGFARWEPRADNRALVEAIRVVLDEQEHQLPITLRQLFYLLVVRSLIEKTDRAYQSLCDTVGRARRAGKLSMKAFRDDGFSAEEPAGWASADSFVYNVHQWAEGFTLDRQQGQPTKLALWCETQGMVPQLQRVANEYSVPVLSAGGFDGIAPKHEQARKLAGYRVLRIGDHDPSGVTMFNALSEDVQAFAEHYGNEITFERIAVTPAQIERYHLPSEPVKNAAHSHARGFTGETVQAEALAPIDLALLVRAAIVWHFDMDVYANVLAREVDDRERLLKRMEALT